MRGTGLGSIIGYIMYTMVMGLMIINTTYMLCFNVKDNDVNKHYGWSMIILGGILWKYLV